MPLILDVIVALGLASAFAGAVRLWRRAMATGRREDLQALAARRGWALTVTSGQLGRGDGLRLAPRGGHAWSAEVRSEGGSLVTDYVADSPRWIDGTLIAQHQAAASAPQASDPRARDKALGPDLARLAQDLPSIAGPEDLMLLSDADPARRMILPDLARALAGWTQPGRPVLILSPEGLRLRLRGPIDRADRMERFVDLAFDLSRVIGP